MKKILTLLSLLTVALSFLLFTPSTVSAKCNGPNGKTGLCSGQVACESTSSARCCDTKMECSESGVTCGANGAGINTAIGCIPVLNNDGGTAFWAFLLKWAVGVGGGIAFLLILYGGFMVMTSAGNPERLKAGQELLTSAISGLILLIFSIFILKFIGIDILGLCKFGFGKTC